MRDIPWHKHNRRVHIRDKLVIRNILDRTRFSSLEVGFPPDHYYIAACKSYLAVDRMLTFVLVWLKDN